MSRFLPYNPEQAYLLAPSVKDELGADHLCFFIRDVVRRLDLSAFEEAYSEEGGVLYAPELMLNVWWYGYALGITSARLIERRMVEDLAFRYLAGGGRVDNWARSDFRRRHGRGINDTFTQVLEWAGQMGWARLGRAVIDSTRVKASACRDRVDTEQKLRNERAKLRRQVRRWQKACERDDSEPGGLKVAIRLAEEKLAKMPRRLERLRKTGMQKLSRTDEDARFLRPRGQSFELGYTAEIAVSDDHLILAQRVTQNATDNQWLLPLVDAVEQQCGTRPAQVLADSGFFSVANIEELARRGIDGYVPDSNLARELNTGQRAVGIGRNRIRSPQLRCMRRKLRSPAGRTVYGRRKAVVEPGLGVLKQQPGMRQFRTRTLRKVGIEFTLAALAYNLTRLYYGRSR